MCNLYSLNYYFNKQTHIFLKIATVILNKHIFHDQTLFWSKCIKLTSD